MKNLWFVSLCALLIIVLTCGWNVWLRIAVVANAGMILCDLIRKIWRVYHGRAEEAEN